MNVGSDSNSKPVFELGRVDSDGTAVYEGEVSEDAAELTRVLKVQASDPEGTKVKYSLHSGTKDNFVIDPQSGWISVSNEAPVLDIQENGAFYSIVVRAEDSGQPFNQAWLLTQYFFLQTRQMNRSIWVSFVMMHIAHNLKGTCIKVPVKKNFMCLLVSKR